MEARPAGLDVHSHQPFTFDIEQLLAVAAPIGLLAPCGRDLPFAARRRKALDVDLHSTRLVRLVSRPFHIGGDADFTLSVQHEQSRRFAVTSQG